ncbi:MULTISPECIES: pyridoxal phosphate-dependent aminotransferase [unclassified Brevibacterium]|uniref:pyridoxal phosphate-dependent aminotransferase n=1 Tax=unclassified Brevibacterium TaxID=2614124 RepID=UPI001E4D5048|nr:MULTISPECIES: pyridoxal phosphate-dependent aminotransferase [unclassified Brevibacterium]MCD1286018.1 pyridoxal phosphate-dependent aminotransferase [Brevibacterium sp. CCUG 69071]MDK8433369.1 pyridoxal phosphate-dependent aminotransferase [Brevibacterium sp. H-BE7]
MTNTHPRVTQMAASYPASDIRKMFTLALDYPNAVKLTVGEPDFNTPEHVKAAGIQGIEDNHTRYVANAGIPDLRSAIAQKYTARWNRPITSDNVMVSFGAMEALTFALDVTVAPGEEVIIPDPSFPNYVGQVHRLGGVSVPVAVTEDNDFKLRAADIAAAITDKTAAIIINSPSNPLGSVMDRSDLEALVDLSVEHGFTIISDEVYDEIVFDDAQFTSIAEIREGFDRFLVVNSFSKTYAMTGWRCGFLIGPTDLIAPMAFLQEGITSSLPGFVQDAAVAAITGAQDPVQEMVASYAQRRDLITDRISAIDGLSLIRPEATFYSFVNISEWGLSSWDLAIRLLQEQELATIPGSAFGPQGEGYLRLTFSVSPETINEACDRLEAFAESR